MKKLVKIGSLLSMVAMIGLSSGCSCNVKGDKAQERAEAFSKQELYVPGRDFTTTYKEVYTQNTEESKVTTTVTTVAYDAKENKFHLKTTTSEKVGNNESVELHTYEYIFIIENNVTVIKNVKEGTTTATEYADPYTLLVYNASLLEPEEEGAEPLLKYNYRAVSIDMFDAYKTAPLNGCATGEEAEVLEKAKLLPDVFVNLLKEKTCDVDKKLFGKDYTYTLQYHKSSKTRAGIKIVVNKDGELESFLEEDTIAVGKTQVDKKVIEYNVSFDNVD